MVMETGTTVDRVTEHCHIYINMHTYISTLYAKYLQEGQNTAQTDKTILWFGT